jgi:hypothetical protein
VTVQLYEAENGRCFWSGKFDEECTDVLAMQDAVSEHIADALAPELSVEASPKKDTKACLRRQSYLTGFFFSNKRTREAFKSDRFIFTTRSRLIRGTRELMQVCRCAFLACLQREIPSSGREF